MPTNLFTYSTLLYYR